MMMRSDLNLLHCIALHASYPRSLEVRGKQFKAHFHVVASIFGINILEHARNVKGGLVSVVTA